jgi:integrase
MKINKLSVLFLLDKVKTNKQGKCPIKCRITYNGARKPFATGLFITPNHWNSKLQQAKPPNEDNNYINNQISLIKQKINQAFLYLQIKNDKIVVEDIYKQFKGVKLEKELGLIEVYNQYNQRIKKLVGIEIQLVTYNKYLESMRHLSSFIIWKYKTKEIMLTDLNFNFILDYEYYLKTERKLQQSTLNKAIQRFRKVLSYAINQNYLQKDPFANYKQTRLKKEVVYLTTEELQSIEKYLFSQIRLEQVKDMFIFCCYTGLAYNEMAKLGPKHIIVGFDGNKWIQMTRYKTNKLISVPLLKKLS